MFRTGYDAPDDNAYIERAFRTIKEEEIWPNLYDTLGEARAAIAAYVDYYNNERGVRGQEPFRKRLLF